MIKYALPDDWIKYDRAAVQDALVEAKSAVMALREVPVQKDWVDALQTMELKREVAGTSRLEGADFTEKELDVAIQEESTGLLTRSQRQARAAVSTYRWIASIPDDRPVDAALIKDIHKRIVTGADDDHCEPGVLRTEDANVTFGQPRHRGVSGGPECAEAFSLLVDAIAKDYRGHDPLIQALAAHYHLAAMHPFLDGNGRTARALGALLKQRAGLRDTCFISMSNYYYDEKSAYLAVLTETRQLAHDLTPFLIFGLRGVYTQTRRVLASIREELSKAVYRNMMFDLFNRLKTPKKRVIMKRQIAVLTLLLNRGILTVGEIYESVKGSYSDLKNPVQALIRDLQSLLDLGAVQYSKPPESSGKVRINLDWPRQITASIFFEKIRQMPRAKTSIIDAS